MEQQVLIADVAIDDDSGLNPFGDLVELEGSVPVCAPPPWGWRATPWPGIYRRRNTPTLALVRESRDDAGLVWRHVYVRLARVEGQARALAFAAAFMREPDEAWMCTPHPDPSSAERTIVRFHWCAWDPWATPHRAWEDAADLRGMMAPKGFATDIS